MNPITHKRLLNGSVKAGIIPPPPPYVRLETNSIIVENINLGTSISDQDNNESFLTKIKAEGLTGSGNITGTFSSANVEYSNDSGATWQTGNITQPYISGNVDSGLIYKFRLKNGITAGTYNETLTLSGPGATDYIVNIYGEIQLPTTMPTANNPAYWKLSTQVKGSRVRPDPEEIGILTQSKFSSSDWDSYGNIGSHVTFNGTSIDVFGNSGNVDDYIVLKNFFTAQENVKVSFKINIISPSFFIYGLMSKIDGASPRGYCHEITNLGRNSCYFLGGTPGNELAFTTKGAVTFQPYLAGDVLTVYLEKNDEFITIFQQVNSDTPFIQTFDTTFFTISTSNQCNTCAPFFMNVNSDLTITEFTVSTTKFKNIDKLCIGDSISQGAYAESYAGIFGKIIGADTSAGGSEFTSDIIKRMPEILLVNPKVAYLLSGLNDVANGVPSATWQGNLISITNTLENAGTVVVHLLYAGFGATGVEVNDFVKATWPTTYIDTATPLENSPGNLKAIYNSGDDHPNAAGHAKIAEIIDAAVIPDAPDVALQWTDFRGNGYDWIADVGMEPLDAGSLGMTGNGSKNMTLSTPLDLTYGFTVYFLVKITSINSQLLAGTGIDRVVLFFDEFNNWISTYLPGTGAYQFNTTLPDFPFDDLSVVALTVSDIAEPAKIYLNGVQLGDFNSTNLGVGNSVITRLMGNQTDAGADAWFHGQIAACAPYTVIHTPQEIVNNSLILSVDGLT